jgi:hypothetical protein
MILLLSIVAVLIILFFLQLNNSPENQPIEQPKKRTKKRVHWRENLESFEPEKKIVPHVSELFEEMKQEGHDVKISADGRSVIVNTEFGTMMSQ